MRAVRLLTLLPLVVLLTFVLAPSAQAQAPAEPIAAQALTGCDWWVYDGARGGPSLLYAGLDAMSPFAMRLDAGFHTGGPTLASRGGLDFDGDGRTDPIRVSLRLDGLYQWQALLSSAHAGWIDLAYDALTLPNLRFGDFDGDGRTDVFNSPPVSVNSYQWRYFSGGTAARTDLLLSSLRLFELGFGRFDADLKTDVFTAIGPMPGTGSYDYNYSSGGSTGGNTVLLTSDLPASSLGFGDFDGDGLTDLFRTDRQADGSYQWAYAHLATGATFTNLARTGFPLVELSLGDFDADGRTDVFATRLLSDGALEWLYWPGGTGSPVRLNTLDGPSPLLGEFTGDGRTDALVITCGAKPMLRTRPPIALPTVSAASYRYYVAELNGDGRADLIRNSLCQGFVGIGGCTTTDNLIGGLLGDGQGGLVPTPVQTLASGDLHSSAPLAADVTGDGLTDMLWLSYTGGAYDVYVARAESGGAFTLDAKQTLATGNVTNPAVADLNGDGRADLLWTTVCGRRQGFGFTGCGSTGANAVSSALAGAGGVFAPPAMQTLGAAGWSDFSVLVGDVSGDGKVDLVFNSTCQKSIPGSFACDLGEANYLYTALGDGLGGFTLGSQQTYGTTGWGSFASYMADVDGDGRQDMLWTAACPGPGFCPGGGPYVIRVGLANGDGTFRLIAAQSAGTGYWDGFRLDRGDMNGDGRTDLLLYATGVNTGVDAAVVYELIADGAGNFTPSPMRMLGGRAWQSSFYELLVGDVSGDGRDELIWTRNDRVLTAGDLPTRETYLPLTRTR